MRRYTEQIEVKTNLGAEGEVPEQFIWQGRLYVVREILSSWSEARPWWRPAAGTSAEAGVGAATTTLAQSVVRRDSELLAWRVEAANGARRQGVVVDIGRDADSGQWQLMRVLD